MIPQSGHILEAPHIEEPVKEFRVRWYQPSTKTAVQGVMWDACERWVRVKASTPGGAIKVANYHYPRGINFQLVLTSDSI
jgi:hypothetical protein